jgi:hypothetical protein
VIPRVSSLTDKGINRRAVIFGTGPSAENPDVDAFLGDDYDFWEINTPRQPYNFQFGIYYDVKFKEDFQAIPPSDGRILIGYELNKCDSCDCVFNTYEVPFNDSGFHALWIASEIMRYDMIFLIGYDYGGIGDRWHWFEDVTSDGLNDRRAKLIERQVHKYSNPYCVCKDLSACVCKPHRWYSKIYNTNPESNLKLFPSL